MFNSYDTQNIKSFGFDELYEGQVIKVNDDNSCYINVYKFFLNKTTTEMATAKLVIDSSNIQNLTGVTEIKKSNSILCQPFKFNSGYRKVNKGDNVLVLFLNGDPQKPFYIDAHLPSSSIASDGDMLFDGNDIKIFTKRVDNEIKLVIKLSDTEIELDKDTKFGTTNITNNNISNNNGGTTILEGTLSEGEIKQLKLNLQLNSLIREFEDLKNKYAVMMSVCDHYKMSDKNKEDIVNTYNELVDFVQPILDNINTVEEVDTEKMNLLFYNYSVQYNALMGFFLKKSATKSGGLYNNTVIETSNENIESVIRDMIYLVNTKENKKFIKDIVEDGIFSSEEKHLFSSEIVMINNEYQILESFAPLYYDSSVVKSLHYLYREAYADLDDYISPMMVDYDLDTEIDKEEFFNKFMDYFTQRLDLYNALYDYSSTLYNEKKSDLDLFANDGVLTLEEKEIILKFLKIYEDENISFTGLCQLYNVSMSSYNSAYSILEETIGNMNNKTQSQDIDKSEFMKDFDVFISARNLLLETIISISNAYIDTLIEGISIGTTNLIYNSSFLYEDREWKYPNYKEEYIHSVCDDDIYEKFLYTDCYKVRGTLTPTFFKAKKGDFLVLSFYIRSINLSKIKISLVDGDNNYISVPYSLTTEAGNEFNKVIVPISIIKDIDVISLDKKCGLLIENVNMNSYDITKIKLEFGTNNSEWSPAPEDSKFEQEIFESIVHEMSSSITQTINQIKLSVDEFYSKVTNDFEEFRKQNASITVEIGNIDLSLSDIMQRQESIIENLGGMQEINSTTTTYEKISRLQLDYEGMHLSVKNLTSTVSTLKSTLNGILMEGGVIESIKGSILDYSNSLTQMGGILTKVETQLEMNTSYIDGMKESISRIEEINNATLTMKGTLDKIENTLEYIQGSSGLDIEFDENGNPINSKYISSVNDKFAGITTTIDEVLTMAKETQEDLESYKEFIGNLGSEDNTTTLIEQISKLIVATDNITSNVSKLDSTVSTLEKLYATDFLNNFTFSGNLNKWSPVSELSYDQDGNLLPESYSNKMGLKKTGDNYYTAIVSTDKPSTSPLVIKSDMFQIDPSNMYKFSIFLKDDPVNTSGYWNIGVKLFNSNKVEVAGYENNSKTSTKNLYFHKNRVITKMFKNYTGYIYPFGDSYEDEALMVKGTSDNCLRFSEETVYMQIIIEYYSNNGTNTLLLENPEMYLVQSQYVDQLKVLQNALISIQPDKIVSMVTESTKYQDDLNKISKDLTSKIEQTSEQIDSFISENTLYDSEGNKIPLTQAINENRQNIKETVSLVGNVQKDVNSLMDNINIVAGLTIMGSSIFKKSADGTVSPESITLYAYIKDVANLVDDSNNETKVKWYIDGTYTPSGVSYDTRSLTISKDLIYNKTQLNIRAVSEDGTMYDEYTIVKLEEGKNAVNMILSNEFIGIPSNDTGKICDYSQAYTSIDIYEGLTLSNNSWTISVDNDESKTGVTGTLNGNTFRITKFTKDNASVGIRAIKVIDEVEYEVDKNVQVTKIKQGNQGTTGASGYTMVLSNEAQVIPVRETMFPYEDTNYYTDIKVFYGPYEITEYEITPIVSNNNITVYVNSDTNPKHVRFSIYADKKILSKEGNFPIEVKFIDPVTKVPVTISKDFTWSCSIQGNSACSVDLIAESTIFKSDDGGITYTPEYINIKPIFKNCSFNRWQISNVINGISFVDVNLADHSGIEFTSDYLQIRSDSNVFKEGVTSVSFKILTDLEDMYDIITITKVYDRSDINDIAEKAIAAYSYIEQNSDKIESAVQRNEFNQSIANINTDLDKLNKGLDNWGYDIFEDFREDEDPSVEAIIGKSPYIRGLVPDDTSVLVSGYNGKLFRFYTSVYCLGNLSYTFKIRYFNKGTLFLNSMRLHQNLQSTTSGELTLNLNQGWNLIEIFTLSGDNAGFIITDNTKLSSQTSITALNAYGVTNDYTNAKYTFSNIEQTVEHIQSVVGEFDGKLGDVTSTIEQTKNEWSATFENTGYRNFLDNGDFASNTIQPWETYIKFASSSTGIYCSGQSYVKIQNNQWTGYQNALTAMVEGLKDQAEYGYQTKITGLTPGLNYVVCGYIAGHRSNKKVSVVEPSKEAYLNYQTFGDIYGSNIERWERITIPFTATSDQIIIRATITKLNKPVDGNDISSYMWIKQIGLYEGSEWRPYLRSGNEAYSGIVTLDMNGVRVDHSASNTYTRLNAEGLQIANKENNEVIAWFGDSGQGARINTLYCNWLDAQNVPILSTDLLLNYYVSPTGSGDMSGRDINNQIAGLATCMYKIKNGHKFSFINDGITVNVADGDYNERLVIQGIQDGGNGGLRFNISNGATIHKGLWIQGNGITITLESPSASSHESHPRPVFRRPGDHICYIGNTPSVYFKGFCLVGDNKQDGQSGIYVSDSRIYIQCIDFSFLTYTVNASHAIINAHANRGTYNVYDYYLREGSAVFKSQSSAMSTRGDVNSVGVSASLIYNVGQVAGLDSQHNPPAAPPAPPPPTYRTYTQSFSPQRYYSTRSYTDEGEYKQGAWTEDGPSYGWWTGHAAFGSQIRDFCSGGSNISMQIYMERLNTNHGYASAVSVMMNGNNVGTLFRGEGKWFQAPGSVVDTLKNGGELTSYYGGIENYIRYNTNIVVKVTVTKQV